MEKSVSGCEEKELDIPLRIAKTIRQYNNFGVAGILVLIALLIPLKQEKIGKNLCFFYESGKVSFNTRCLARFRVLEGHLWDFRVSVIFSVAR